MIYIWHNIRPVTTWTEVIYNEREDEISDSNERENKFMTSLLAGSLSVSYLSIIRL
jgi:hypothetical protein